MAYSFTILRHCVPSDADGLSPLQVRIISEPAPIRVFSAPTGAGKSHAFIKAARQGQRVLFVVPTRRLAQNLAAAATRDLQSDDPQQTSPVAIWTSDETARLRDLDPGLAVQPHRVRQARNFGPDTRFLVATPESLAAMLLRSPSSGHGSDPFSVFDLASHFDHIVFDEFHTIDSRGFGLCALIGRACAAGNSNARVTFLSATPIDLLPVLLSLGVGPASIATGTETVVNEPAGEPATPGLRAIHGDVHVSFSEQSDLAALLLENADAIRACLARERQLVVIMDSVEALFIDKQRLAGAFDQLGIKADERLAINSIDDRTRVAALGGLFVTDRTADPTRFKALLATSSVEMGVTFAAGMIVMDPGHDALSFVQRIGRVARGDEPGTVVVRLVARKLASSEWLRCVLSRLSGQDRLTIGQFLDIVLASTRSRFTTGTELASDAPPSNFRSMPQRAAWAACVFWYALERAQWKRLRGQRDALLEFRPAKVKTVAGLLMAVQGDSLAGHGAKWVTAFLEQTKTLRNFTATVKVVEPDGTIREAVPLRLINRHPGLAASPLIADNTGEWALHIDRPLDEALRGEGMQFVIERQDVLLPDGQVRSVAVRDAVPEFVRTMKSLKLGAGTSERESKRFTAAIALVRLSGLVPGSDITMPQGSSGVL